jgi:hypothetical protein
MTSAYAGQVTFKLAPYLGDSIGYAIIYVWLRPVYIIRHDLPQSMQQRSSRP